MIFPLHKENRVGHSVLRDFYFLQTGEVFQQFDGNGLYRGRAFPKQINNGFILIVHGFGSSTPENFTEFKLQDLADSMESLQGRMNFAVFYFGEIHRGNTRLFRYALLSQTKRITLFF